MITINRVTNKNTPAIVELILPIQQQEFGVPITLEKQPDLMDIEGFYYARGGGFWCAQNDDHIIGTIGLIVTGNSFGVVRKMFVHKDFRGKQWGIGQQLLDTLIRHSRQTGMHDLYLGTIHTMEAAARFYLRNGFVLIAPELLPESFPRMPVDDRFYHLSL